MAVYMAVDPGGHNGVAVNIDGMYHTCTIMQPKELWDLISQFKPEKIAYETFSTGGLIDRNMNETIQLVGSIKGICHVLGIDSYPQPPQSRKAFLERAQAILKNERNKTIHERDALAHLLLLEHLLKIGHIK